MQKDLKKISDYWQEMYSSQVKEYRPFEISADFKRYASMFALGKSYLYIVNLYNFELEYISDSVEQFLDMKASEVTMKDLLQSLVPEEIDTINLKGKVISDFYTSFLKKKEVLAYKNMFSYKMQDSKGEIRTMLYQAMPLSVLENGTPEHVFCIQTDISHLQVTSTNDVSFINMNGGKCYFNVDISSGKFDPLSSRNEKEELSELFSEREIEIIHDLAEGLNAERIAEKLNLSPHTVKTHRRNILHKSGCKNTAQLIAKCLTGGVISVGLN